MVYSLMCRLGSNEYGSENGRRETKYTIMEIEADNTPNGQNTLLIYFKDKLQRKYDNSGAMPFFS